MTETQSKLILADLEKGKRITLPARYWAKVVPDASGCWIWTGCTTHKGYGRFGIRGAMYSVHRLSYAHFKGAIPDGLFVCHTCDVRDCVNPNHLFVGTPADNAADMIAKCRQARGVDHGNAKLTERDVVIIRKAHGSQRVIADKFGVHKSIISDIKLGKTWRHVQ